MRKRALETLVQAQKDHVAVLMDENETLWAIKQSLHAELDAAQEQNAWLELERAERIAARLRATVSGRRRLRQARNRQRAGVENGSGWATVHYYRVGLEIIL